MPKVSMHTANVVGPGAIPADRVTLTIAPAYAFVDGTTINWPVPVKVDLIDGEATIGGMETEYLGEPLVWAIRLDFYTARAQYPVSYPATKVFPEGASGIVEYADMIDVDPVSDIPGYGPSWAEQARLEAVAAGVSSTTATEQATIATTKATEVATLASSIATGSPYFMQPILTGGNINTARPTLPGGAAWPGPVIWSSQIGRPTNFLAGTDYWEAIAADPLPAVVYFSDDFARADGASLVTPVGSITPATTGTATPVIMSGALGFSAVTGTAYTTWDAAHADGVFKVKVGAVPSVANGPGVVFRFSSATNHFLLTRVSGTLVNWRLVKRIASATAVDVFVSSVPIAANDTFVITMNGNAVAITLNGAAFWSGTLTELATNTKHGVTENAASISGASTFDDISLTALA